MADEVDAFLRREEPERGPTSSTTWSNVRGRAARKNAFNFANASSMGLKSGLYGRNRSCAPARVDRRLYVRVFVDREIIEHHDIAGP